jgi:hypothetical protein
MDRDHRFGLTVKLRGRPEALKRQMSVTTGLSRTAPTIVRRTLSIVRWNCAKAARELCMCRRINRAMSYGGARRIGTQEVVPLPVIQRANRPGDETTTAVGAHVLQDVFHAGGTEGALVTTNARFK